MTNLLLKGGVTKRLLKGGGWGKQAEDGGQVARGHSGSGRDAFGTGQPPLGRGGSGGRYRPSSAESGALYSAVQQVPLASSAPAVGPPPSANGDPPSFDNMLSLDSTLSAEGAADVGANADVAEPSHTVLDSSTNVGKRVFASLASDPYMKYLNEVRDKPFSPTNSEEELVTHPASGTPRNLLEEGVGDSTSAADATASLFNGLEVAVKPNQAENLGGSFTGSLI